MKTQKMKIETKKGAAIYKKIISESETPDYETDAINERRFYRALRKASGFKGRGLRAMRNSYGRSMNNDNGISVHGRYEEYAV